MTCIDVLANDYDIDGDVLTVNAVTQGSHGTVSINPITGELCYDPDDNYTGEDTFTYTLCDDNGCDEATVNITVEDAAIVDATACENPNNPTDLCTAPITPIGFCVEFCNLDETATIQALHTTFDCGLELLANNCIEYLPLPGQLGNDVVEITACDETGACEVVMIPVMISNVCNANACENVTNPNNLCTEPMTAIEFCLEFCELGNDYAVQELHTTFDCGLEVLGINCVRYIPLPGFLGADIIEAIACNDAGQCQTIFVNVNVAADCTPISPCENVNNPDNLCTEPMTAIEFCVEFCELNETAAVQELHTTFDCGLEILGINCVRYTPLPGFVQADVIEVTACDDTGACQTILVNVNVAEDCSPAPCDNTNNPDNLCTLPMTASEFCVEFCT